MQQKVWPYPLPAGTKVVVKFQSPTGSDYYAGVVLKWSQKLRRYFVKAADGNVYPAMSPNVKPFDTNDLQQLTDWLVVAERGPVIVEKPAHESTLKEEGIA